MSKYYILKRYYPYLEDDDEEEIIYVTDDYKDAVETAAHIHKTDMEILYEEHRDDDDYIEDYYSTVVIETATNEQRHKNYKPPKEDEVYYFKVLRAWIQADLYGRYYSAIGESRYDYYLRTDENLDYVGIPEKIIPHIKPESRIVQTYRYSENSDMNITFMIINNNFDKLDDYDKHIQQLIQEATDLLNSGENMADIEQYIKNVFDNTTKEWFNMKIVNVEIIESYSRTVAIEIPDNIELEDQNNYITEQAHKEYQMSENKGSKSVLFKFENIGDEYNEYTEY